MHRAVLRSRGHMRKHARGTQHRHAHSPTHKQLHSQTHFHTHTITNALTCTRTHNLTLRFVATAGRLPSWEHHALLAARGGAFALAAGDENRSRSREGTGQGTVKGCKATPAWADSHLDWCPWGGWGEWGSHLATKVAAGDTATKVAAAATATEVAAGATHPRTRTYIR